MSVTLYVFTIDRSGSSTPRHPWAVVGLEPDTRFVGLRLKDPYDNILARRFDHALSAPGQANELARECLTLKGRVNTVVDAATPTLHRFFDDLSQALKMSESSAVLRTHLTEPIGKGPVDALLEGLTDSEFARWRTVMEGKRWT